MDPCWLFSVSKERFLADKAKGILIEYICPNCPSAMEETIDEPDPIPLVRPLRLCLNGGGSWSVVAPSRPITLPQLNPHFTGHGSQMPSDSQLNITSPFEEQMQVIESDLDTPSVPEPMETPTVKWDIVESALTRYHMYDTYISITSQVFFSQRKALIMTLPNGFGYKHTSKGPYKNGNVAWRCTVRDKQIIPRPSADQKQKFTCLG